MSAHDAVLVTRPEPQAAALGERLRSMGIPVIVSPALRFEPLVPPDDPVLPPAGDAKQLLVFTSPRAVEHGFRVLPRAAVDRAVLAAIGPATARALSEIGLSPLSVDGGHHTSENLLGHPALRDQPGDAAVVTAPGGRGVLLPGLEALGWRCRRLDVYRRVPCTPGREIREQLASCRTVISAWTSGEAMAVVLASLDGDASRALLDGCFVVASPRLQSLAHDQGAARTVVAASASNDDLLQAIAATWRPVVAGTSPRHESSA